MPRIEQNGDIVPCYGRKVSDHFAKGIHLTQIDVDDDDHHHITSQKETSCAMYSDLDAMRRFGEHKRHNSH